VVGITDDAASPLARVSDVPLAVVTDSASYADSPTAAAAVAHILATLATASAKGARRRMEKRDHLTRILQLLEEDSE
jgi:DNA-binding MurR/RpiR family transcriptional regulator